MATRGTTTQTANRFRSMSKGKRPATSGNKNVKTGIQGNMAATSQKSKVAGIFSRTHTGPYLGSRSV